MTILKSAAAATAALFLLFAGCSNLDDTTDLGSGFVKNHGDFDVEEFQSKNQNITAAGSFQDSWDSLVPGITYNSDLSTGRFADMRTISYLEFNNDSLDKLYSDIINESDKWIISSVKLKFELDTTKSSSADAFIEVGTSYLNNHLDVFEESNPANDPIAFTHTLVREDSSSTIIAPLDPTFFFFSQLVDTIKGAGDNDSIVPTKYKDVNTMLYTTGKKIIKTISSVDSTKILDTLASLAVYDTITDTTIFYSFGANAFKDLLFKTNLFIVNGSDTLPLDTITDSLNADAIFTVIDTTPIIKLKYSTLKTTIDTIILNQNEAYDVLIDNSSFNAIYGDIKYVLSDTIRSTNDSIPLYDSLFLDTIHFKPLELIVSSDISPIINSNGTVTYDTNSLVLGKYEDIKVIKTTNISTKDESILDKLENQNYWFQNEDGELSRYFTLYLKQLTDNPNSLQFYSNPRIEFEYSILDSNENIVSTNTKTLVPGYKSYSILEDNESSLATEPIVNGAADRMMRLKLDISEVWDSMRDSTTNEIIYRNIPKLDVTFKMDSAVYHRESSARVSDTSDYFTYFYYKASADPITSLWDPSLNDGKGGQISRSKCDTVWLDDINDIEEDGKYVTFEIDKYVQEILNNDGNDVPDEVYLTVWLYDNSFTEVMFDTTSFDMDFIISNLKEDDE